MSSRATTLRLGTRGSDLALTQSGTIATALERLGARVELEVIRTSGDRSDAPSFASIGPQGVFVREIEQALLARTVDLAVHSFKDLPTRSPAGLGIAAVPPRADAADLLLCHSDALGEGDPIPLRAGARVGTASARRAAWLRFFRPDLQISSLRGNVPTRIRQLRERRYDAILLAAAGLERLRPVGNLLADLLEAIEIRRLEPSQFVPAPAQGALAVQCRDDDTAVREMLAGLDHPATRAAVTAERNALTRAEGGCDVAFGAHCFESAGRFELVLMLERAGIVAATSVAGPGPVGLDSQGWAALELQFEAVR